MTTTCALTELFSRAKVIILLKPSPPLETYFFFFPEHFGMLWRYLFSFSLTALSDRLTVFFTLLPLLYWHQQLAGHLMNSLYIWKTITMAVKILPTHLKILWKWKQNLSKGALFIIFLCWRPLFFDTTNSRALNWFLPAALGCRAAMTKLCFWNLSSLSHVKSK